MQARHDCLYCGNSWVGYLSEWKDPFCERCQDKQIRIRKVEDTRADIFGYKDDEIRIEKRIAQEKAVALRASAKAAEETKKAELEKAKIFGKYRSANSRGYDF